jgi:hypothetical protein
VVAALKFADDLSLMVAATATQGKESDSYLYVLSSLLHGDVPGDLFF